MSNGGAAPQRQHSAAAAMGPAWARSLQGVAGALRQLGLEVRLHDFDLAQLVHEWHCALAFTAHAAFACGFSRASCA